MPLGMVLVFQKLVFLSNFSKSIRHLKNAKKTCWQKFFAFLNMYLSKTQLIKIHNSLDSSKPYGRLLENQKTGGSRELLLPENDFQTSSAVIL